MSLGVGINKESYLMFLCGYLLVFTLLLSFLCATINNGVIVTPIQIYTTSSGSELSTTQYFANMTNLFTSFLIMPLVDTRLIDYSIQIPFLVLPKFGILVILVSYIKDMIP